MPSPTKKIIVVGAGVLGLTTALTIKEKDPEIDVLIIAKELPGDDSYLYSSSKAGAQWYSYPNEKPKEQTRHLKSYRKFQELSTKPECWVKEYDVYIGWIGTEEQHASKAFITPWYKDVVTGYKHLGKWEEKFPGVFNLFTFKSFTISPKYYLQYLLNLLVTKGVRIQRQTIESLTEAYENIPFYGGESNDRADIVINCTGFQYNMLKDGNDPELHPVRGHIAVIENNLPYQINFEYMDPSEPGDFLMVFPRKEGGAAFGGIYDEHSPEFDTSVHNDFVENMKRNVKKHVPELCKDGEDVKIVEHMIGFRSGRGSGPRVEIDSTDKKIVHNYGCDSLGFVESWGTADDVWDIVKQQLLL